MTDSPKNALSTPLDRALFEGQVQGIAVTFYQNERPPCGLAGIMDWHFRGVISQCIQKGAITGRTGECTYFPLSRHGSTFHLILAGAGQAPAPGSREMVSVDTLRTLQKNLISLGFSKIGISRTDFGGANSEFFTKHLKGVPLWIAP